MAKPEAARGGILVATGPWDPEPWAAAVRARSDRPVAIWPDVRMPDSIRYVMAWKPPAEAFLGLPHLKAIFSLGAGVDHLVFTAAIPDVPMVRVVNDDLTLRMTEWVVLQVLLHHRQHLAYARQQAARRWHELPQPAALEVRVGMMGLGVLGASAARALAGLGFDVAGWSRRRSELPGIRSYAGAPELDAFLARTDILVALLPLTAETRGLLAMPLFRRLAQDGPLGGPVLINAGRGGLQVEADIVAALEEGVLKAASLDVFEEEPLPAASPLWSMENVVITPHAAAWSSPEAIVAEILAQIDAFEHGHALRNVIDRVAMY